MNFYHLFYCRAYNWYSTNQNKSKETLRLSAIALISSLPSFNIVSLFFFISIFQKHTLITSWDGVLIYCIFLFGNLFLISSKKSDSLLEKYLSVDIHVRKKFNILFNLYLIISIAVFFGLLGYIAYYKKRYGNYD